MIRLRIGMIPLVALAATCGAGSTFGSGVGESFPERAPWYAGARATAGGVGHFPVTWQSGEADAVTRGAERSPAMRALRADLNALLDSLNRTAPLRATDTSGTTPPDVMFGCVTDASGDCVERGEGDAGRLRLAVARPSGSWIVMARGAMSGAGVERVLVITLEPGLYWLRQRGLRGDKYVELGTGHEANLPWMTSLETPVSILQLTGALVDTTGRAIRIGAEGLLARRTSLPVSALGARRLISEEDIEALRTARRADLPGQPLVWREALRVLVMELTGAGP